MGGAKRMMEEHEIKRGAALAIAIEAGVLETCEFHDDCIFECSEDIESAYKLGNAHFTAGKLEGIFESRREMTDIIKEVVDDHLEDGCPSCAKIRDED